jgi:hypothetical protein
MQTVVLDKDVDGSMEFDGSYFVTKKESLCPYVVYVVPLHHTVDGSQASTYSGLFTVVNGIV